MLCEKCGKFIATTHIHTVVNGVEYEQNLCDYCAKGTGVTSTYENSLGSMLASMFGDVMELKNHNVKRCPVCSTTFSQIAESGKVGCTECYKTFKSELLPYLKRVHGSTNHTGKRPNTQLTEQDNIDRLKRELSRLIKEENYEQAAVVRDEIKKIEGEA